MYGQMGNLLILFIKPNKYSQIVVYNVYIDEFVMKIAEPTNIGPCKLKARREL